MPAPRGEGAPPVAGPPGAFGGGYAGTVCESVVAKDATVTLTDGEPPKGQAFYRVVVSVP